MPCFELTHGRLAKIESKLPVGRLKVGNAGPI